jgi:hypothetical protein
MQANRGSKSPVIPLPYSGYQWPIDNSNLLRHTRYILRMHDIRESGKEERDSKDINVLELEQ